VPISLLILSSSSIRSTSGTLANLMHLPGSQSTKLDEITSVAWNQQVQYVLASSSSTGYTVVWDLRGKREVVALAYGGGAGTLAVK